MPDILQMLNDLLSHIFGSTKLRPYESMCLEAWKRELSGDAVAILERQLELYDLVQRQSAGKLVCFYCIGDPTCKKFPEDALFPFRPEDAAVARVILRRTDENGRASLRADLFVVHGRFFNIEFSRRPTDVFPRDVKSEDIEVSDVKIVLDPMSADPYAAEPLTQNRELQGWLQEWEEKWALRTLRQPLPPGTRARILENLDTRLPPDYLELTMQTEGLEVEHCQIHGLSQIRKIVWPDESFYILVEVEERGALGVRQGASDGVLYYLGNEDDEGQAVGTSFRAFIEKEIESLREPGGGAG